MNIDSLLKLLQDHHVSASTLQAIRDHYTESVLQIDTHAAQIASKYSGAAMRPYQQPAPVKRYAGIALAAYLEYLEECLDDSFEIEWTENPQGSIWHTYHHVVAGAVRSKAINTITGEIVDVVVNESVIIHSLVEFTGLPYPDKIPYHEYRAINWVLGRRPVLLIGLHKWDSLTAVEQAIEYKKLLTIYGNRI